MSEKVVNINKDFKDSTWEEFRMAGMLEKANEMLLEKGWVIVAEVDPEDRDFSPHHPGRRQA